MDILSRLVPSEVWDPGTRLYTGFWKGEALTFRGTTWYYLEEQAMALAREEEMSFFMQLARLDSHGKEGQWQ